jgi:ABC-type sugar transport system permease subunit
MKRRLTLDDRKAWMGVAFVTPWLLGFLFLFAVPLVQSFHYSLNKLEMIDSGLSFSYEGLANYKTALLENAEFNRALTEAVVDMVLNVPMILFFSLFTAVLLNQKFHGRALARAIFFLPVILASGVIANMETSSFMTQIMQSLTKGGAESGGFGLLQSFQLERMLIEAGLNLQVVDYLTGAVDRIYEIISASGVQILIFLAGLQSISPSLYEASKIEGATSYESFWKITFPMVSPLILTNMVYTIIDGFNNNQTTKIINDMAFGKLNFGLSAAMSWLYLAVVALVLAVCTALVSRKVFYHE